MIDTPVPPEALAAFEAAERSEDEKRAQAGVEALLEIATANRAEMTQGEQELFESLREVKWLPGSGDVMLFAEGLDPENRKVFSYRTEGNDVTVCIFGSEHMPMVNATGLNPTEFNAHLCVDRINLYTNPESTEQELDVMVDRDYVRNLRRYKESKGASGDLPLAGDYHYTHRV